jgi:hypothetical protein
MERSFVLACAVLLTAGLGVAQEPPFDFGSGLPENLTGSTVAWVSGFYDPAGGTTSTICFLVSNTSPDGEWVDAVSALFPATWAVACSSQDPTDSGGNAVNFDCLAVANFVVYNDNDGGLGEIEDGQTWGFCVDVTPPAGSWPPPQTVSWVIDGDESGDPPHNIPGSLEIVPVELMSISVE